MVAVEAKLPYLTFFHRPCRGYDICADGEDHLILSPVFETAVEFSSLVLSVDYVPQGQDWLMSEVQVCQNDVWSPFFKMALYSSKVGHSFDKQENNFGSVHIDVLKLKKPVQAYRFRLTIHGSVALPKVWVCVADPQSEYDPCVALLPMQSYSAKVDPISQMQLPVSPNDQIRLCSPTSLTMALNALGKKADPLETAAGVYDERANIYGNWTLNTAYACHFGVEAFVARFRRLNQLADFVKEGSFVLASIAYERGALSNAAIRQTPGHFVLICGWENNCVKVADPAAAFTKDVIRLYNAEEFARAWLLNKRGISYIVRKK